MSRDTYLYGLLDLLSHKANFEKNIASTRVENGQQTIICSILELSEIGSVYSVSIL